MDNIVTVVIALQIRFEPLFVQYYAKTEIQFQNNHQ
jgi:hypothetical protein